MNWYFRVLKNTFVFKGRASRIEFWMFILIQLILMLVLSFVDGALGFAHGEFGPGLLSRLYLLATFLPLVALSIRRLHDTARSGWWFLVNYIPVIGTVIFLVFMAMPGDPSANEYGSVST